MSLKINALGMNNNLAGDLNKQSQHLGRSLYTLPALVPQYKDGGPVTPKGAMQFKGPGTGKSDSIEAKLQVGSVVLPIETVQKYGADKLKAMMALFDAGGQAEGNEEVDAKVSNGEMLVPSSVTQQTGSELWTALIESSTGEQPQPEMGEHGEMMAAGGGLMDERMASQQFWQNAPPTPVPVPGRANPPNPAELMTDRLANSAQATAQQAPGLRAQMAQSATPVQRQVTTPIPAYATPAPNPNPLKNANAMMGGEAALATGLAYDVLNSAQNAGQVNGAIAGLKQKAGFDPASTPYPSLKNYAKGGEVKGYAGGGYIDYRRLINDTTGVTPNEKLGRGRPSVPNASLPGEQKALVPTGQGNVPPVKEPILSQRAPAAAEPYNPNFTAEPSGNPGGTMNANRALVPNKAPVNASGTTSNAARQAADMRARGFGEGLKNSATQAPPAPTVNERGIPLERPAAPFNGGTLKSGLKNVLNNLGGAGALSTGLAYDVINSAQIAGQANDAIAGYKQRAGFDANSTPYPGLKDTNLPRINADESAPPSLKQAVTPPVAPVQTPVQPPQTQQQSVQAPQVQGALPPAIGKSANWYETGYRTDDATQTLGWNESRWSNSGDPAQDAALAERQGALTGLRQQANLMNQYSDIAGALNPGAAILPQGLAETKRQNDLTNTRERDKMAQPAPPKYGSSDGQVYQQEGAGAQEFNQNVKKKFTPAFNTEDLSYLPQDATDNDILGFKTMPKYVWEGFADDVAKSGSPQEQESKVAEMARRSGIGIAALKSQLYPR